MLAKAVKEKI